MGALIHGALSAVFGLMLVSASLAGCRSTDVSGQGREAHEVTALRYDHACEPEGSGCNGGTNPVLVANPDAREYLLLWQGEYRPGEAKLYARRVEAKTGEPIGHSAVLASLGEGEASVAAVYDEVAGRYVVVWTSSPTLPVRGGTSGPEILELSARLKTTRRKALPATPALLLSLDLGRSGRGLVASLQYPPSPYTTSGLGDPKLALTPILTSTGAGRSRTLDRWPDWPGAVGGTLAHASKPGRHLVVTFRREPDAFQNPRAEAFVTRLVSEEGRSLATGSFEGVRGSVPVSVRAAFNRRRSEYLVAWSSWLRGDRRQVLAQRLNVRGTPIGAAFTVADVSDGHPDTLWLDVDATSYGYAVSWSDGDKGWLKLVRPGRTAVNAPRIVFDAPPPGGGLSTSAATNVAAGTYAQAWTAPGPDVRIYLSVVPLAE